MSAERPSSPGHLGGPAAQAVVEQERIAKAMAEVRKVLNSRPPPGMEPGAKEVPKLQTRESIIASARANTKGGKRRKSHRKSRKNRKSRKSRK